MADITYKRFDTYPPLGVTLTQANGSAVDLTTASAVYMTMKAQSGTVIPSVMMSSSIATAGYLKHYWQASEMSMADSWQLEWVVFWAASNGVEHFPNDGTRSMLIEANLNPPGP